MKFKGKVSILALATLIALATAAQAVPPMQAWEGTQWKELTQEIKVAYIQGMGNMASFENTVGGGGRAACISRSFVEELKGKSVGQVVSDIDKFYQENPAKLKTPVIEVVLRQCTKICPAEPPAAEKKK
ncbi:MAG: hypothetical protein Q8M54_08605 [Desulfobaccales bacterium]|nr:hypothetical protein [Desulfobaccales bacterium]